MRGCSVPMAQRSWIWMFMAALWILVVATVMGDPFEGMDLDTCVTREFSGLNIWVSCCMPDNGRPLVDFHLSADPPMRVRREIHSLDAFRLAQLERGIGLMKALPKEDPRSWYQQYQIHCAYTTGVYQQIGGSDIPGMAGVYMHRNWFFFPFHTWYIYFIERIIGKLVDDHTFAMPYWAWDVLDYADVPHAFKNTSSPLWDEHRLQHHLAPGLMNLMPHFDLSNHDADIPDPKVLRASNNNQMQGLFDVSKTQPVFFGGAYRKYDDDRVASAGAMEVGPHLAAHFWVVDVTKDWGIDMGQSHTSARDALFMIHHSQVDRLWRLWIQQGGRNPSDPDFLDATLQFYDENANFVRVKVSDALDKAKMGITFEEVETEYLRDTPFVGSIRARGDVKYAPVSMWRRAWRSLSETISTSPAGDLFWVPKGNANVGLSRTGAVSTASVLRLSGGMLGRSVGSIEEFDELLVVRGVATRPSHVPLFLRVFVELPEADFSTPQDCLESVGQIYVPAAPTDGHELLTDQKFEYKVGMGRKIEKLGIDYLRSLQITFVAGWGDMPDVSVKLTEIRMELQKV